MSTKSKSNESVEQNTPLGGCILAKEVITFNENKPAVNVQVRNTGDRPIQVGSHFHFLKQIGPWNLIVLQHSEKD